MRRRRITAALPFFAVFILVGIVAIYIYDVYLNKELVSISHESGIYDSPFQLEIQTRDPSKIYYTTDGTVPEVGGENSYLYEEPIELAIGDEARTYSIQFKCYFEDGTESEIFKREFILESDGLSRYHTNYIVSITGNEEDLFGYEEGIFVRGRQFDEYMAANPDVNILNTVIPANYFSDEELPVHVSIFSQEGTEMVSKECGIRIYGNVTRAKNQKSFRLYARDEYDGDNKFNGVFLPNLISDASNMALDEYQRLSFHSSGNDNGYAFVRTALIGELARQSGFSDVLVAESAVVYVNGKYQGLYWLQNTFDDKYFKEKYGDYVGEMVTVEGKLSSMDESLGETDAERICSIEYDEFCDWVYTADLNVEENWQKVCDTIDIENFARYMAIEYYINNRDWPDNNVKAYRYLSAAGYTEDSVFDGKYRYLLFDTDYGLGLKFLGWFGYDETEQRLEDLLSGEMSTDLFIGLMRREEFKNLFVNAVLLLSDTSFSASNVEAVLTDMAEEKDLEIQYMFEETDLMKNSLWESDDNNYQNVLQEHAEILQFAKNRPAIVRSEIQAVLNSGQEIPLSLEWLETGAPQADGVEKSAPQADGVGAISTGVWQIDGMEAGESYEGYCFANIPMTISCDLPTGYVVEGYYVNGEHMEGATLKLIPSEWLGAGEIVIVPEIESYEEEELSIYAYDMNSNEDYIILMNTGNVDLLLSDYAISDSLDTAKGRLPGVALAPGETYVVCGLDYMGEIPDNGMKVPFSWNNEEMIVLSNITKGIIQTKELSR